MGKPGKIAFPVILVLGAITGYITYTSFTAATPQEDRIDSPYYQPLPPASSGNEPGSSGGGGAAQQQGGGGAAQQQGGGGAASTGAGTTTITILQGSAVQESPDYDPDTEQAPAAKNFACSHHDTGP